MDTQILRTALGRYATGVTIVSCRDADGGYLGLTVNSFSAMSLQPPLVLWALRESSPMMQAFVAAPVFAVNVLAATQVGLSQRFASRLPDKFAVGEWSLGAHGAPVLAGCAALFECQTASHQVAGDHRLFIGRVLACTESALAPLVFQGGQYRGLGAVL
jgi:flavin reductase (DIM6/NTAB) family NADH-FMN oxidoreductase RutF